MLDGTELPEPTRIVPADVAIRMPGIGGTGVVTVSQVLAAAAQIEGVAAHAVDQTGLSQKAGPVVSTVTLGEPMPGQIDVLIGVRLLASVTRGQPRRASIAEAASSWPRPASPRPAG